MKGKGLVVVFALILAGTVAFAARTTTTNNTKSNTSNSAETTAQSAVHHETGKVSSMTSSDLVVNHKRMGKEEKTNFVLNSGTKQEGKIEQGDRVTVYYHDQNGKKIATEIKVVGSKTQTTKS
jgi:hypothetical protein